jgi:hypothetical protein
LSDEQEQVEALLAQARRTKNYDVRIRLAEEAVRLADLHNDEWLAFKARGVLVEAGTFGGCPDKALVAFTWRRARVRKAPERFDRMLLLWEQKWVVARLTSFRHMPLQRVRGTRVVHAPSMCKSPQALRGGQDEQVSVVAVRCRPGGAPGAAGMRGR